MVHTATEAEFMFPLDWQPLGAGVGRPSGALEGEHHRLGRLYGGGGSERGGATGASGAG